MPSRVKRRCPAIWSRFAQSETGSAAVEFAIIAAILITLTVGALELFVVMQAQAYLETAAEEAGRLVLTGQAKASTTSQAQFKMAVCGKVPALLTCSKLMVDIQVAPAFSSANVTAPTITYDSNGNINNTWKYDPGGPGSIIVLRLMYQWPVFPVFKFRLANQTNSTLLLMATSVFKNEAYQ